MAGDTDLIVNTMTLEDLPGVMEVENDAFVTPWSEQSFINELTRNYFAHYLVARHAGRVVGYAGMWLILNEAHVTNVAVHSSCRGLGVGERLMKALIETAKEEGATRMTLEVRITNAAAQSLYQKLGFKACGIRPGYYIDTKEDAIIMWKVGL